MAWRSRLGSKHVGMFGHYHFELSREAARGLLRYPSAPKKCFEPTGIHFRRCPPDKSVQLLIGLRAILPEMVEEVLDGRVLDVAGNYGPVSGADGETVEVLRRDLPGRLDDELPLEEL